MAKKITFVASFYSFYLNIGSVFTGLMFLLFTVDTFRELIYNGEDKND